MPLERRSSAGSWPRLMLLIEDFLSAHSWLRSDALLHSPPHMPRLRSQADQAHPLPIANEILLRLLQNEMMCAISAQSLSPIGVTSTATAKSLDSPDARTRTKRPEMSEHLCRTSTDVLVKTFSGNSCPFGHCFESKDERIQTSCLFRGDSLEAPPTC